MIESTTKTAVITAVLTGLFTVVAGIATYWLTTKEPELSFSLVGGPTLSAATGVKRIFVIEVRNSGKKEIAHTLVHLALTSGELSEVAVEASPGVKLTEDKTPKQVEIRADLLNPSDVVKVSFLTSLPTALIEPRVVVRAPGVQAVSEVKKDGGLFGRDKSSYLPVLLATSLAAAISSLVLLTTPSRLTRKLGLPAVSGSIDQSEVCAYVCGAVGLFEEADRLRFGGSEISYRGAADYLRHRAAHADPANRPTYRAALCAVLLNEAINPRSIPAIRAAIDKITPTPLTDEEYEKLRQLAVDEGESPVTWRQIVDDYVAGKVVPG